jgi:hypothetical protein
MGVPGPTWVRSRFFSGLSTSYLAKSCWRCSNLIGKPQAGNGHLLAFAVPYRMLDLAMGHSRRRSALIKQAALAKSALAGR